jgi:hypothetical protein
VTASPPGIYTTADGTTPTDGDPNSEIRSTVTVGTRDQADPPSRLTVTLRYRIVPEGQAAQGWRTVTLEPGVFSYAVGPFTEFFSGEYRTYIDVEATVTDRAGNSSGPILTTSLITVRDYSLG